MRGRKKGMTSNEVNFRMWVASVFGNVFSSVEDFDKLHSVSGLMRLYNKQHPDTDGITYPTCRDYKSRISSEILECGKFDVCPESVLTGKSQKSNGVFMLNIDGGNVCFSSYDDMVIYLVKNDVVSIENMPSYIKSNSRVIPYIAY